MRQAAATLPQRHGGPVFHIKDIDFPMMAKFSEHDVKLPGVDIAIKPVRSYVYGALAGHILGYVGMPDDIDKDEQVSSRSISRMSKENRTLKSMDEYLRGNPVCDICARMPRGPSGCPA